MAVAKWLIHVDWNGDGDFSDANEDVTSDVLGVTLEHFRDLSSEHMEAARLELQLKNDDHKYSPPNGSLPLSGNLKPGRTVWVRAAYPYDAFSDVAGTQLADHTLDNDSDFSWTENSRASILPPEEVGPRRIASRATAIAWPRLGSGTQTFHLAVSLRARPTPPTMDASAFAIRTAAIYM